MPKVYIDELLRALGDPKRFIAESERAYNDEIDRLCGYLCAHRQISVVLLAGPSGSGKTTTANILKDRLIAEGMNAAVVSLDNFFKNKEEYPKHADGSYDYESVQTLDIDTIHRCLGEIIESGRSVMPRFDFPNQRRAADTLEVCTGQDGVVIVEGIHALNPIVSEHLRRDCILELFVSVSTGIKNADNREIISGKQIRMLRRMIRDNLYRGFDVQETFSVWSSVLSGEDLYLYPYKHFADIKINTFHGYELFVYNDYIKNNLSQQLARADANGYYQVFEQLEQLPSLSVDMVPHSSLLREFLPDGKYESVYRHG